MSEAEVNEEKLPPFVVKRDGEYHLLRGRAWAWAIAMPFLTWGLSLLLLAGVLRFAMGYNLDGRWWASSLQILTMFACLGLGFSAAGVLKQQRAIKRGIAKLPWYQVSLIELLVIATAAAGYAALASAHYRSLVADTPVGVLAPSTDSEVRDAASVARVSNARRYRHSRVRRIC